MKSNRKNFKIWGSGDIVKKQENYDNQTSYNHIEALVGNDYQNHINVTRQVKNLHENEEMLYSFLNSLTAKTNQNNKILKSFEIGFEDFELGTTSIDFSSGENEEYKLTIDYNIGIEDVSGKYFTLDTNDPLTKYYAWYNLDGESLDPGQPHPEKTDVSVSFSSIASLLGKYFIVPDEGLNKAFYFTVDGSGDAPGGYSNSFEIAISSGNSSNTVATQMQTVLNSELVDYETVTRNGAILSFEKTTPGFITEHIEDGDTGFTFEITQEGVDQVDGTIGRTVVSILITSSDSKENVASATASAINSLTEYSSTSTLEEVTISYMDAQVNIPDMTLGTLTFFTLTKITEGSIGYKAYAVVKSGIVFTDNHIYLNKPSFRVAERQLIDIFKLSDYSSSGETVEIIRNDSGKFEGRVFKNNSSGNLQEYVFSNGGVGYDYGVQLIKAITLDVTLGDTLKAAIGENLEAIQIEPSFNLEEGTSLTRYVSIYEDDIQLLETDTGFTLWSFEYTLDRVGNIFAEDNRTDLRQYMKNYNVFEKDLFFNLPNGEDETAITNPYTDDTVDYSEVQNDNMMLTVLRKKEISPGVFLSDNAVFGYCNETIKNLENPNLENVPDTDDVFYLNKDLVIKIGADEFIRLSSVASTAASGFPIVDTYQNLKDISGNDGNLYFVSETNSFYRYSSEANGWIYTSDPYKNHHNNVLVKNGLDSEGDNKTFKFNSTSWKRDGGNISVYINGIFQAPNLDYTILDDKTIEFTSVLENPSESTVIVKVVEGGENYFPDRVNYVAGTPQGLYDGNLKRFQTNFPLIRDRIDVYKNGILLKESVYVDEFTSTDLTVTGSTTLTFTGQTWTIDEFVDYFIFVKSCVYPENVYEVRKIISNTADTITIETGFDRDVSLGDVFEIHNNYDHIINEGYDEVILFNDSVVGDYIEIRNRAAVVSNYKLMARGTVFPTNPVFGMEFYNIDESSWYKYNGDSWIEI
jgi:hypothetical protein